MKYYIIAGEVSGDLHGANLMRALQKADANAEFRFWGGERMKATAGEPIKHIKDLAFMGFWEVVTHLGVILKNMTFCRQDILNFRPDAVILIDYPGFNLPIAKFCHKHNIRNFYYIAPQVWAWKKNRIRSMRKHINDLFVILPFEKKFFAQYGMDVHYHGNPLLDEITKRSTLLNEDAFRSTNNLPKDKPIVAILPGSRMQEITKMLPIQSEVAKKHPDLCFVIAGVPHFNKDFYDRITGGNLPVVYNQTHNLLHAASTAMVTSGTATLEAALFNVPEVVCYKANIISYWIARHVAKIKYISLVNLIMDKPVVRELIQHKLTVHELNQEFCRLHYHQDYRHALQQEYSTLRNLLGKEGVSQRVSNEIIKVLS